MIPTRTCRQPKRRGRGRRRREAGSDPNPPPEQRWPEHPVPDEIRDIIRRCHFQTAKTVEHVEGGQHSYVVAGWNRDDVSENEFWDLVRAIRTLGREEEWTAPRGFYDSGRRPTMRNRYLYPGDGHSYWFTTAHSTLMVNRERLEVQERTRTRRVVQQQMQMEVDR